VQAEGHDLTYKLAYGHTGPHVYRYQPEDYAPPSRCAKCQRPTPPESLVTRSEEWEDGGQRGYDEIDVCLACAKKLDEADAYEEYLADPFNRAYEAANAIAPWKV
jgi:hypothetical protein